MSETTSKSVDGVLGVMNNFSNKGATNSNILTSVQETLGGGTVGSAFNQVAAQARKAQALGENLQEAEEVLKLAAELSRQLPLLPDFPSNPESSEQSEERMKLEQCDELDDTCMELLNSMATQPSPMELEAERNKQQYMDAYNHAISSMEEEMAKYEPGSVRYKAAESYVSAYTKMRDEGVSKYSSLISAYAKARELFVQKIFKRLIAGKELIMDNGVQYIKDNKGNLIKVGVGLAAIAVTAAAVYGIGSLVGGIRANITADQNLMLPGSYRIDNLFYIGQDPTVEDLTKLGQFTVGSNLADSLDTPVIQDIIEYKATGQRSINQILENE